MRWWSVTVLHKVWKKGGNCKIIWTGLNYIFLVPSEWSHFLRTESSSWFWQQPSYHNDISEWLAIITEEISLLECKSLDKFRAIPRRDQCYSTEVLFIFRGIAQHISGFLFCITDQILFKPKIFFDKKNLKWHCSSRWS